MKSKTQLLVELGLESRTRFSNLWTDVTEEDLKKTLAPGQNSIGFLIRHIGDVELLFGKNVFGDKDIHVTAKTVIDQKDTGDWTDLSELLTYVDQSFSALKAIVEQQTDADWETTITTKEFGTKTKAEAFGRIVSHTAYHAGQLGMIKKHGSI